MQKYIANTLNLYIQSASRSPPGLASDHQKSVLCLSFSYQKYLKNKTECWPFLEHFSSHFSYLWGHFLSNFRPLGALWGRYGLIFGVRKWLGAPNMPQDCPKGRQHQNTVTFLETFWGPFFVFFLFFA